MTEIHHYNPYAFHGRGIAVVLDNGHRAESVTMGDRVFKAHPGLDKGRKVYVSYGRPGAYGQLVVDGEVFSVPPSRSIVYGSDIRRATPSPREQAQPATQSEAPSSNPLLSAAGAAAPMIRTDEGGADWLDSGLQTVRRMFGGQGPEIPTGSNLAANLNFGATTNAIPGAVGSYKGPAAFSQGSSTAGSGVSPGVAIPAVMLAAALYSRGADDRKEGLITERFHNAFKGGTNDLGEGFSFVPGTDRSYLVGQMASPFGSMGYAPGSPARLLSDALLQGPGAGRGGQTAPGLVEYKNPSDKDAIQAHIRDTVLPLQAWASTMPRFQKNDAAQEQASKWVDKNPAPVATPMDIYERDKSGNRITVRQGAKAPRGYTKVAPNPPPPPKKLSSIRPTQGQQ